MRAGMRNRSDQYQSHENQPTHALLSTLRHDGRAGAPEVAAEPMAQTLEPERPASDFVRRTHFALACSLFIL